MWETSARLLRLLSLSQAHPGFASGNARGATGGAPVSWSGAELAERLGAIPRTVDANRLRELGYPVHSPGHRWRLPARRRRPAAA